MNKPIVYRLSVPTECGPFDGYALWVLPKIIRLDQYRGSGKHVRVIGKGLAERLRTALEQETPNLLHIWLVLADAYQLTDIIHHFNDDRHIPSLSRRNTQTRRVKNPHSGTTNISGCVHQQRG